VSAINDAFSPFIGPFDVVRFPGHRQQRHDARSVFASSPTVSRLHGPSPSVDLIDLAPLMMPDAAFQTGFDRVRLLLLRPAPGIAPRVASR